MDPVFVWIAKPQENCNVNILFFILISTDFLQYISNCCFWSVRLYHAISFSNMCHLSRVAIGYYIPKNSNKQSWLFQVFLFLKYYLLSHLWKHTLAYEIFRHYIKHYCWHWFWHIGFCYHRNCLSVAFFNLSLFRFHNVIPVFFVILWLCQSLHFLHNLSHNRQYNWNLLTNYSFCSWSCCIFHHSGIIPHNMQTDFPEIFCSTDHKPKQKRFSYIVIHSQFFIFYNSCRQFLLFHPNWICNFSNLTLHRLHRIYYNFFYSDFVFIDCNYIWLCLAWITPANYIYLLRSIRNHWLRINPPDINLFPSSPLAFTIKNKSNNSPKFFQFSLNWFQNFMTFFGFYFSGTRHFVLK